jgi:hypothetical protein
MFVIGWGEEQNEVEKKGGQEHLAYETKVPLELKDQGESIIVVATITATFIFEALPFVFLSSAFLFVLIVVVPTAFISVHLVAHNCATDGTGGTANRRAFAATRKCTSPSTKAGTKQRALLCIRHRLCTSCGGEQQHSGSDLRH